MRNKLVSAFLCMLMFSGLVLPLMVTNTSDMLELAKPLNRIELSEASYIWHHDCSNTTGFVSQSSWDTSWYSAGWTLDNGLLSSSGTNLSISSIPSGSGWHGPAFTYEFGTTFNVSEVLDFTVDLQIDNAAANYLGRYYLYLADTNQLPTYLFTYHDYLAASTTGAYGVQYFFENGTYFAHGSPSPYSYTGFDGRMETGLDGMNVYGYVDGFGAENITILDEFELSREIKYVVFMGGAFGADPLMPSWLHDISLTTSVPIQMAMPRQLASWHHDCSNITAFDGVADDTWYGNPDVHIDGSISSISGYLYADDYGTGTVSYGPMIYHTFSSPFYVSDFSGLEAEIELEGLTPTPMGAAAVVLFDDNQDPVIAVNVADGWTSANAEVYVSYDFSNGTRSITPFGIGNAVSTPYWEKVLVSLNSTGIYASIPRVGIYHVLDYSQVEHDRIISYIAVNFRASASSTICERNRIHDILLEYSASDLSSPIYNWHHDCSNTTGFVYNDTWNMNWMPWDIQTGTLASDGSMLSVTSVVTGSGWHGPVFEYELPGTFRVRDIENLTAVFDVDNSLNSYLGYEVLMFGDSDRNPVIFCSFHDGWADYRQGSYGVAYVFPNGSYVGFGSGYPVTWTSFSGKMNASYTEAGLLAYVDGHGEGILPGLSETDFNREIKYVAIASARFGSDPLIPVRIDEIFLNHILVYEPLQPTIDDVADFGYEAGTIENVIVWNIANFSPTSYELYRDGGLLASDVWPSGFQIEVNIDNLALGVHNYTIVVFGEGDIVVSDTVMVNVVDTTPPILNHPSDVLADLETSSIQITWQPTDLFPLNYVILKNGTLVSSGLWTSGENLTYTIDQMVVGSHNITIIVWDTSGNYNTDTVFILIESEPTLDYFMLSISVSGLVVIVVVVGLICRNRGSPPTGNPSSYDW